MSTVDIENQAPATRQIVVDTLREQASVWLFVFKTMLAFFLTGWIAMRLSLPAPATAMLTTIIVANRQSGMVLAKSFYRAIGTLGGAVVAFIIVAAFPQQRDMFLVALSLWLGICSGGATLYRNFKSYAFVLGGYTAAIIAIPVIDNPPGVFDSATSRISEVLLGLLVSGVVNDVVFPSRMRDVLRRTAREQFAHFVEFVRAATSGSQPRGTIERAHLRFVRAAVTLEDLRSSVIFEDAEARARSGHLQEFNQRFMAASTSFQSLHHLVNRLKRARRDATSEALIELYTPLSVALDAPIEAGAAARVLLPRLIDARRIMAADSSRLRSRLSDPQDVRDFDTGAALLRRFSDELYAYVDSAATLQAPRITAASAERVRFARGNDYAGALLATFRTTLTMLALGTFWILSAWPMGSSAMLLATIFAGLFAAAPNPTRVTGVVTIGYLVGMVMGFICVFFVLTQVDGYPLMVMGIAPFLMIGLAMMMSSTWGSVGLGYSMGFAYILALKNPMVYDPVHFINDAIAQIVGLSAAAIAFVFVPTIIGSRWLRTRQLARLRGQVALAAEAPLPGLRHRFESVNHDLVSQVVSHTEPGSADSRTLLAWALAVHETGRALIALRHDLARGEASPEVRSYVTTAIAALARFYESPDAAKYLLARDATATAIAAASEQESSQFLLEHLHLIRMALLDGESVLAAYMPTAPLSREVSNAP
ncbi:putative membrane protein YccC [Luteibacter sp. Sphag1AF]|uniref:FUSC family protein n=1 Tax=Luteibacter sp. Sphag1AF TaxID=2587031 RepID=UPI001621F22F|nr:FUSC family protein [Luteibacter sp. Sphag1AF]MBB3226328.1 putative membrane protein YccC [Luteibacter sp. Sphag1AF]